MPTELTTPPASILTDGTVQTLYAPPSAGIYLVVIDVSPMQAGDSIILACTAKVRAAGSALNVWPPLTLTDAQVEPNIVRRSMVVVAPQGCTFTIQKTAGTNRTYSYRVDKIASCTVIAEGTLTFTNNVKQTLTTSAINGVFVLLTDHSAQAGGDTVIARLETAVVVSGSLKVVEMVTLTGAQSDALGLARQQSVAEPSDYSMSPTLQLSAGANHSVPWALCQVGS